MIRVGPARSRVYIEEQAAVAASVARPYGIGLLVHLVLEVTLNPLFTAATTSGCHGIAACLPARVCNFHAAVLGRVV